MSGKTNLWISATQRASGDDVWQPVLQDLLELDQAGALAGIRAIIAARLALVRDTTPESAKSRAPVRQRIIECVQYGQLDRAGAMLAAEIDRREAAP